MASEVPPLTESEYDILQDDGRFILLTGVPLVGESILWGIYLVTISFSTFRLSRKGITSRPRRYVLALTLTMFAMSTALLALGILRFVLVTNIFNLKTPWEGETLDDRYTAIAFPDELLYFMHETIFSIEFLLGDTIVVWRTWTLYEAGPDRVWMILPFFLWIAAFAILPAERVTTAMCQDFTYDVANEHLCRVSEKLYYTEWALTMGTNAIATCMIAYKAWHHRRLIKETLGPSARKTLVEKILALLVESGFLYLIFWAVMSISLVPFRNFGAGQQFANHIAYIGNQVVGLYPTCIVLLVDLQRTIWDNRDDNTRVESSLTFAHPSILPSGTRDTWRPSIVNHDMRTQDQKSPLVTANVEAQ